MPSPRRKYRDHRQTIRSAAFVFSVVLVVLLANSSIASAQISKVTNTDGRQLFINAEPPVVTRLMPSKHRATIYLPEEVSFLGSNRPAMNIDRDGVEKLVREAADRHRVDPALVRAVIETESNWNPAAQIGRAHV